MYVTQLYKYEKGGTVYVGGDVPEGGIILEVLDILNAKELYTLIRVDNNEDVGSSVWLREGDSAENYKEEELIDANDN